MTASLYERVGEQFFVELTRSFYEHLEDEPVLREMYPADPEEFAAAEVRLRNFLIQYWGGPDTYSAERGHPRLRMRHLPFPIDEDVRNVWVRCMEATIRDAGLDPDIAAELMGYFTMSASAMINK